MIHKSIPNPDKSASKSTRVSALVRYVTNPDDGAKCVHMGALNFVSEGSDIDGIIAEMTAVSEGATRSRDPLHHCVMSWPEGEDPTPEQIDEAVQIYLAHVGMAHLLCVYAMHQDTDNVHLHIVLLRADDAGRVHKINGGFDKLAGAEAVAMIEAAQGWKPEANAAFISLENGEVVRSMTQKTLAEDRPPAPDHVRDESYRRGEKSALERAQDACGNIFKEAETWQDLHTDLLSKGLSFRKKGSGAVIVIDDTPLKASDVSRAASMAKLVKALGPFEDYADANVTAPAIDLSSLPEPTQPPSPSPDPSLSSPSRAATTLVGMARKSSRQTQFDRYHEAVDADRYRVTVIRDTDDGKRKAFILDRKQGETIGFTPEEVAEKLPEMIRLDDKRGENVYLTPLSSDTHHLVIDDLTDENLGRMKAEGYAPSIVIESSPKNFQAIFSVPRIAPDAIDQKAANAAVRQINKEYGDPNFSGAIHPHRAPGFHNRKEKHRRDGVSPVVRIAEALGGACKKMGDLLSFHYNAIRAVTSNGRKRITPKVSEYATRDYDLSDVHVAIYRAHRSDIERSIRTTPDMSRIDAMVAERLRALDYSRDDIADVIEAGLLRNPTRAEKHQRARSYAEMTADYAEGPEAHSRIQKNARWVSEWKRISDKAADSIGISIGGDKELEGPGW